MSTLISPKKLRLVREFAGIGVSAIAGLTVVVFGFCLLYAGQSLNVVTWVTWAALDALIFYNQLRTLSDGAWLSGCYTAGASLVAIASLYNATWHWGVVETVTTIGVVALFALRARLDPRNAIIIAVAIMVVGEIPLMYDSWFEPYRPSWWMWGITALCDFVMLFMTRKWSVEDSLFSGLGGLSCAIMTWLVLR